MENIKALAKHLVDAEDLKEKVSVLQCPPLPPKGKLMGLSALVRQTGYGVDVREWFPSSVVCAQSRVRLPSGPTKILTNLLIMYAQVGPALLDVSTECAKTRHSSPPSGIPCHGQCEPSQVDCKRYDRDCGPTEVDCRRYDRVWRKTRERSHVIQIEFEGFKQCLDALVAQRCPHLFLTPRPTNHTNEKKCRVRKRRGHAIKVSA